MRNQITRMAWLSGLSNLILGPMISDKSTLPSYDWPLVDGAMASTLAGATALDEAQRG